MFATSLNQRFFKKKENYLNSKDNSAEWKNIELKNFNMNLHWNLKFILFQSSLEIWFISESSMNVFVEMNLFSNVIISNILINFGNISVWLKYPDKKELNIKLWTIWILLWIIFSLLLLFLLHKKIIIIIEYQMLNYC